MLFLRDAGSESIVVFGGQSRNPSSADVAPNFVPYLLKLWSILTHEDAWSCPVELLYVPTGHFSAIAYPEKFSKFAKFSKFVNPSVSAIPPSQYVPAGHISHSSDVVLK